MVVDMARGHLLKWINARQTSRPLLLVALVLLLTTAACGTSREQPAAQPSQAPATRASAPFSTRAPDVDYTILGYAGASSMGTPPIRYDRYVATVLVGGRRVQIEISESCMQRISADDHPRPNILPPDCRNGRVMTPVAAP